MTRILLSALILSILAFGPPANAGKVKTWYHHAQGDFDKAKLKKTVVSNQGIVRLSRELRPLAKLDAAHVWDVVEDTAGNLVVATGDDGKLFQVKPDGTTKVLLGSKESQILCLARTPEGVVYAGTGPGGQIVRLDPDGKHTIVAENLGKYVWSLTFDQKSRTLYAGTGPKGQIYRVGPNGKATVHYTTRQDHVLSVAYSAPNLYAGTDKQGLVYRIDAEGKGFVLFHAPQSEVRSLVVDQQVVYAGTSAPASKRLPTSPLRPSTAPLSPGSSSGTGSPTATKPGASTSAVEPSSGVPGNTFAAADVKGTPASAPSAPPPGDNSLYRIAADGTVRELFRERTLLLSLLRLDHRLLIGTGMQGQLFEVDEPSKERVEIARLDHGQIHCLLRRKDGSVVLGTGDPGRLYVLENRFAAQGSVTSEVLDAKIISAWGAITWKANTPKGTSVKLAVRSGNVSDPDDTWSDWSRDQTDAASSQALAPKARYLQYRITLSTEDAQVTPEVRQVALRYRTTNQAPEITSLDVPDLDAVNLDQPKKFRIKWSATDPNEDELTFNLYVRKEGWKDWVLLEENLDRKEFEWDTTTAPSGLYQVKVTTSDRRDNPPEEALTAEKFSAQVPISHLPPTVTVKLIGVQAGKATLEATATDPLVRLTEASYTVNGKRWTNVFPSDGLFDSKLERFRFTTEALRLGTHVLLVRVRDAAGNLGSGDVVFSVRDE